MHRRKKARTALSGRPAACTPAARSDVAALRLPWPLVTPWPAGGGVRRGGREREREREKKMYKYDTIIYMYYKCIYIYIYTCVYMDICVCIYKYIHNANVTDREAENGRRRDVEESGVACTSNKNIFRLGFAMI